MAIKKWRKVSSKQIHKNPWFELHRDAVIRPNGDKGEYYYVKTNGNVVFIVAQDFRNRIAMIKQYRYLTGENNWELPAGNSDGQTDLVAARRELLEETGYKAMQWSKVGSFYSMHGISTEKAVVFSASELTQTGEHMQEEEGITECKFFSSTALKRMIRDGTITDGETIAALHILFLNKR